MLEYSEYKDLIDILQVSNHENTYQELMKKEEKTLDTVNNVVRQFRDKKVEETQFVNMPVAFVVNRFFNVWIEIWNEVLVAKTPKQILAILSKDDRLIYIGVTLIILSIMFFFATVTTPEIK